MVIHDLVARYVGIPLVDCQRALLPSTRERFLSARRGLRFRAATCGWSQAEKEDWILKRLRQVVRDAARDTAYYAELFKRIGFKHDAEFGFEEFSRIPALERRDIADAGAGLLHRSLPRARLQPDASGGSTGEPVRIWVGPEEFGWRASSREFFYRTVGIARGARVAFLWGHHLDPSGQDTLRQRLADFINNQRWFDCFRLSPEMLSACHQQMEAFRPDCIVAYASALAALAEFLEQRGIRPNYPRTCIVTGAEKLFDAQRERAERVFMKPIHEQYGSRDVGGMAFQVEIPASRDLVVDWSNILLEPESTDPQAPILVTKLHADGMAMIRYRIGDVGTFPQGSRPGYPVFRLPMVLGRAADGIWVGADRFVTGIQFPHLLKDFPVREFAVLQNEDYSVEVRIVPGATFSHTSSNSIMATLQKNLPGLPITIVLVDAIQKTQANKWRPVVSRVIRPGSMAGGRG